MNKPAPRKILMTADPIGGVWTYALELARALALHGAEIALATMGGKVSAAQRAELAALPNMRLFESVVQLEWMDDPWTDVDRAGDWLLALAADLAPDVVHLNGFCHGALPWNAPVLVVAHSCVLSWWTAVRGEEAPPRYDEYRRRVRAGLQAAAAVVAPTGAMLDALEDDYGPLPCGQVIHNAREPHGFAPADKQPLIFSAGRVWDQAKNVGALDRVAPAVPWPVYIAGATEHPNGSQVALRNAIALGKLSPAAMATQLAASAIYALPARYEPFGLSALEAGLCGCALVLGDIPSLREVWGDAALFVDPANERALTAALNGLIEDDARRAELGQRARRRAMEFSPQRMAREYLAVYDACLHGQPLEVAA